MTKMLAVNGGILIGVLIGLICGYSLSSLRARRAIIEGPASENYPPALSAIADAKSKLAAGDTNVIQLLHEAESQIERARQWSRRF